MEGKKQIKVSLKVAIILVFVILIITAIIIGIVIMRSKKKIEIAEIRELNYKCALGENEGVLEISNDNGSIITAYKLFDNYDEYQNYVKDIGARVEEKIDNCYLNLLKEQHLSEYEEIKDNKEQLKKAIKRYKKIYEDYGYEEIIKERTDEIKNCFKDGGYTKEFFNEYSLLLVERSNFRMRVSSDIQFNGICIEDNYLNVHLLASGGASGLSGKIFFITLKKDDIKNIEKINIEYDTEKTSRSESVEDKPIIYLYPTKETEVSVKLMNKDNITVSYPKYLDGWNVIAKPDGTLTDLATNRELYALYYESENAKPFKIEKDGFVVKGEDTIKFLEEKLAILGLNEREAEEFIVYWLPILESNEYNYIRFATEEEINANMPLEINPKPDTTIRVLMSYKGLNEPIDVKEQKLETPERQGFVAVEWGGTEIK